MENNEIDNKELNKQRIAIEEKKKFIRESIDGCLNRISITDDQLERQNKVYHLMKYILEYTDLSRKSHDIFNKMYLIKEGE